MDVRLRCDDLRRTRQRLKECQDSVEECRLRFEAHEKYEKIREQAKEEYLDRTGGHLDRKLYGHCSIQNFGLAVSLAILYKGALAFRRIITGK